MEEIDRNNATWPVLSSNINIIENIWLRLKRHLQSIKYRINSQDQLITEIGQRLSVNYICQ